LLALASYAVGPSKEITNFPKSETKFALSFNDTILVSSTISIFIFFCPQDRVKAAANVALSALVGIGD
jgi:hypothetical protein